MPSELRVTRADTDEQQQRITTNKKLKVTKYYQAQDTTIRYCNTLFYS